MKKQAGTKLTALIIILALCISLSGCNENLRWYPVYKAAIVGGLVGTIVGHQHDEDCAGAVAGAIIGGTGCLLKQIDELKEAENITLNITNNEGKAVQIALKYKDGFYICPHGERYSTLPNQEELRVVFGL